MNTALIIFVLLTALFAGAVAGLVFYARALVAAYRIERTRFDETLADARAQYTALEAGLRYEREQWAKERHALTNRQLLYRGSPTLDDDITPPEQAAEGAARGEETLEQVEAQLRAFEVGAGISGGAGRIAQRQALVRRARLMREQRAQGAPPRVEPSPNEPRSPHESVTDEDKAALDSVATT